MSLYLCVLDFSEKYEKEVFGVEVGSYAYFGFFRDCICKYVEKNRRGSVCPNIMNHEDANGFYTPEECTSVIKELSLVRRAFEEIPVDDNILLNSNIVQNSNLQNNLSDYFVDIDGCNLITQLELICECAVNNNLNVYFQ